MEKICKICGWHLHKQVNDCCVALGIPAPVSSEVPEQQEIVEEVEELLEEEEVEEEEVEEEEDEEDLETYLDALPVKELKKLCKEADLDAKGKKADLVERLLE